MYIWAEEWCNSGVATNTIWKSSEQNCRSTKSWSSFIVQLHSCEHCHSHGNVLQWCSKYFSNSNILTSSIAIMNFLFLKLVKCHTSCDMVSPSCWLHKPACSISSLIREGDHNVICADVCCDWNRKLYNIHISKNAYSMYQMLSSKNN